MTDETTFEFINDKAELEAALSILSAGCLAERDHWGSSVLTPEATSAVAAILELVPRLMKSYEEALELTYTLADAWESYMDNQTPAGLYVPS